SASFPTQLLILLAISAFVIVTVVGDLGGFVDDSVLNCLINKGGELPSDSCFLWVNDIIHGDEYGDKEINLFLVWFNGDVGDGNLGLGDGNLCLGITGLGVVNSNRISLFNMFVEIPFSVTLNGYNFVIKGDPNII
nr:hypothetical protein [Tanacetum cinerariifolium]